MLAVLVFDSASVSVLGELEAAGRLGALAELRRRGRWHSLVPAVPSLDTGHFTLYTGRPVGEHGLHYLFQWAAAKQRLQYVHEFPVPQAFWERAGTRALVLDPYECWDPRAGEGVFLRGFQFSERLVLPPRGRPATEWRSLTTRLGPPPRVDDLYGRPSVDRLLGLRSALIAGPARAAAVVEAAVRGSDPVDLLYVGFGSAHLGGHHFWDLSQLPVSERERARAAGLATALHDVYVAVDDAVGRMLEVLPADTDVLVVSPSGMGPNTSRSDLLPGMLRLVLGEGGENGTRGAGDAIWRLRGSIPTSWRARAVRPLPDGLVRRLTASLYLRGVDWRRTRAFAVPGDYRGFVRLNVRGRERDGIVEAGAAESLLAELASGLATFCDPDGAPAVESVDRTAALVEEGPGLDLLPDLVVRWSARPATELAGVSSPRFGDVRRFGAGSGRAGNHTDDAWILAVPGRSRLREPARPPDLVDVAATAAALAGTADARVGGGGEPLFERS
jgi:hypothetical protein